MVVCLLCISAAPQLTPKALMESRKAAFDKHGAGAYQAWLESSDLLIHLQKYETQLKDPVVGPSLALASGSHANLPSMLAVAQRAILFEAAQCKSICELAGVPGAVGVRVTLGTQIKRDSGSPFDKRLRAALIAATAAIPVVRTPAVAPGSARPGPTAAAPVPVRSSPTAPASAVRVATTVGKAVVRKGAGNGSPAAHSAAPLADCTACRNERITFESLAEDDDQYALVACTTRDCMGAIHFVCFKQIANLAQAQHCVSLLSPTMCKPCHDEEVKSITDYPTLYLKLSDDVPIVRVNARAFGNVSKYADQT